MRPRPSNWIGKVDVQGVRSLSQVASTSVCAETGSIGVPVGAQIDTPVMIATGWPLAKTWVAPTIHWPVTQGPLPAGGTNAHPATA